MGGGRLRSLSSSGFRPIMARYGDERGRQCPEPSCARRPCGASRGLSLGAIFAPLADLLLPPVCVVCRTRIGRHGLICGACFAKIDFIAPPLCDRLGVPLPYDAGAAASVGCGHRQAPSLRPGAGRGALFLDHARADPELQISGSARGPATVRPLAEEGRRRAARRRRSHRAGAALRLAALVAALQSIGDAGACGRTARARTGRLLRAQARAADGKPGRALG